MMIPTWLTGIWAKIAGGIALVLGLVGAKALYDRARRREGAAAERVKSLEAARNHETKTSDQVRKSDEAVANPASDRARRVRRQFERDD